MGNYLTKALKNIIKCFANILVVNETLKNICKLWSGMVSTSYAIKIKAEFYET